MAIHFTAAQQRVLDARDHDILVSAAAGSGKTAVLVERIVRLVSEGRQPLDIDRLLVVTFTRAAAAQMRERIGIALTARLRDDPGNVHLQRQEVLLHNAQITTMDSFFTFLLRNYFSDIDLDPSFRQIDATESRIIAADVLKDYLEEKYAQKDPAFLRCAEYFCPGNNDSELEKLIRDLCEHAGSHPSPEAWLGERASDYDVRSEEELFRTTWMRSLVLRSAELLRESQNSYEAMQSLCLQPGGPDTMWDFLEKEKQGLFRDLNEIWERESARGEGKDPLFADPSSLRLLWESVLRALDQPFSRYPALRGRQYADLDPELKENVKNMRLAEKKRIQKLGAAVGGQTPEMILAMMETAREPIQTLSRLALEYYSRLKELKRERRLVDFVDLEHFALDILARRAEDGSYVPRRAALALRSQYAEILIDEYQDSNEVQELLLRIISGEDEGRYNRFMVGDIKQSIYRFRLARPEIFMEKYDACRPGDDQRELIELDQNFRSRKEVLDFINALFMRIMRREVGGVEYNDNVSLKPGAVFPDGASGLSGTGSHSPYLPELLLLDTAVPGGPSRDSGGSGAGQADEDSAENYDENSDENPDDDSDDCSGEEAGAPGGELSALTARQKEAVLIADRIRRLVGVLPVRDEESGQMRPARYGDIVILLRSTVGWIEDLRAVFEREGIPSYAESRTGYFKAAEIRAVIQMLRVLDNPRQDIPLFSALRGYFGDFSQDEIARIRLLSREGLLFDSLCAAAGETSPGSALSEAEEDGAGRKNAGAGHRKGEQGQVSPELRSKCVKFLEFVRHWRTRVQHSTVAQVVNGLLEETGYRDYCAALPGGAQRTANLRLLSGQADAFTEMDFTGLFQFLRHIDSLNRQEIDYGEANILDESADVVRIMTIHKSKGLEFPICFVAGLSKGFSFRKNDSSGPMLFDGDWGVGINCYDTVSRVRTSTLRREEIAEKIRRDCMGEELRVLYVALTRAKEKLIMTASLKGMEQKVRSWITGMSSFFTRPDAFRLSPVMIGSASCFAQLICQAAAARAGQEHVPDLFRDEGAETSGSGAAAGSAEGESDAGEKYPASLLFPARIRVLTQKDLVMREQEKQFGLMERGVVLKSMEGRSLEEQPDPSAAKALASRVFRVYPHEELSDLYAQTSVSELKHRAMAASLQQSGDESGEGSSELFPEQTPVPYIPAFIQGREQESPAQGARRGTAFHRLMELLDYSRREDILSRGRDGISSWITETAQSGRISPEDAAMVSVSQLETFLRSDLARRMAEADKNGSLFREQPFVMGCAADRIREDFPADETVVVQGIIDAFFIEKGKIVLVDYKTDRVSSQEELVSRYRTQLLLYAEALERGYSLPVSEKVLYSTSLAGTVPV